MSYSGTAHAALALPWNGCLTAAISGGARTYLPQELYMAIAVPFRISRLAAVLAAVVVFGAACSSDSTPTAPAVPRTPAAPVATPTAPTAGVPAGVVGDVVTAAGASVVSDLNALADAEWASQVPLNFSLTFDDRVGSTPPKSSSDTGKSKSDTSKAHSDTAKAHSDSVKEHADTSKTHSEPRPAPPKCVYSSSTGLFVCPAVVEHGLTTVRSYGFLDAQGHPMTSRVVGQTASVRYLTTTDGTLVKDANFTSSTHRVRDQTVSGLLGSSRIWDGTGASADTNTHTEHETVRKYVGTAVDTMRAVTYLEHHDQHPYPVSGTSIHVVNYTSTTTSPTIDAATGAHTGTKTVVEVVSKRVVVTFDGTANAALQVGGVRCTLHLDTKKVDGCT